MMAARNNRLLLESVIAPSTKRKYLWAIKVFLEWCLASGTNFCDADSLQEVLLDWFHETYYGEDAKGDEVQGSYDTCNAAYCCILHGFPLLKGRLPLAYRALKNWKQQRPSVSWPPMSWELTVAVAMRVACAAGARPAIAIMLAWQGLFRASEVVNIRKRDVLDPRVGHLHAGTGHINMVIAVPKAKTGKNQSVMIDDNHVADLVRLLASQTVGEDEKLFPFSTTVLRRLFKQACKEFGLDESFVLHSLRHGKATHLLFLGHSLESIMERGRWVASDSVRKYLQKSKAVQIQMSAPKEVLEYGAQAALRVGEVLEWACAWHEDTKRTLRQMQKRR
jgi:hypothetical protein